MDKQIHALLYTQNIYLVLKTRQIIVVVLCSLGNLETKKWSCIISCYCLGLIDDCVLYHYNVSRWEKNVSSDRTFYRVNEMFSLWSITVGWHPSMIEKKHKYFGWNINSIKMKWTIRIQKHFPLKQFYFNHSKLSLHFSYFT